MRVLITVASKQCVHYLCVCVCVNEFVSKLDFTYCQTMSLWMLWMLFPEAWLTKSMYCWRVKFFLQVPCHIAACHTICGWLVGRCLNSEVILSCCLSAGLLLRWSRHIRAELYGDRACVPWRRAGIHVNACVYVCVCAWWGPLCSTMAFDPSCRLSLPRCSLPFHPRVWSSIVSVVSCMRACVRDCLLAFYPPCSLVSSGLSLCDILR